ncbi:RNase H domain protein [Pholiota molesta]|nr:RNase H domain protein [Pholiota molesta]
MHIPAPLNPRRQTTDEVIRFANRYLGPSVKFTLNSRRYPAPASQDPLTIFKPMINMCSFPAPRWIQMDPEADGTKHAVLIYTDGSAPENGLSDRVGPDPLTSNRAELRAAHAALGFEKVVIATDSEYLVFGVNEWVIRWKQNGWKNKYGFVEMLLTKIEALEASGIVVQFYLIARKYNLADKVAKKGAEDTDVPTVGKDADNQIRAFYQQILSSSKL